MTALFSAMLIVCLVGIILIIARYYGSSSLAGNLLMTLAFSIAVGLGIRTYINYTTNTYEYYNKINSKNVKLEKATVTNNSTSMPLVSILQIDTIGFKVSGKKKNNYVTVDDSLKGIQQLNPITNPLCEFYGIPICIDSS